jgi:hypothetical protein
LGMKLLQVWRIPKCLGLTFGAMFSVLSESVSILCNASDDLPWMQSFSVKETETLLSIVHHFCEALRCDKSETMSLSDKSDLQQMVSLYPAPYVNFFELYFSQHLPKNKTSDEPRTNHVPVPYGLFEDYGMNSLDLSEILDFVSERYSKIYGMPPDSVLSNSEKFERYLVSSGPFYGGSTTDTHINPSFPVHENTISHWHLSDELP